MISSTVSKKRSQHGHPWRFMKTHLPTFPLKSLLVFSVPTQDLRTALAMKTTESTMVLHTLTPMRSGLNVLTLSGINNPARVAGLSVPQRCSQTEFVSPLEERPTSSFPHKTF